MGFVGYTWLRDRYAIETAPLTHASYMGGRARVENRAELGLIAEYFTPNYYPGDHPLDQVEFALKYDDLNLDLLQKLFDRLPAADVAAYIDNRPTGRYARQIGFLYEFLTGKTLALSKTVAGNYVDLLDVTKYVTAAPIKHLRWRINDNLLGPAAFCPIVRKTEAVNEAMKIDFAARLSAFAREVPTDLFRRAVDYLYFKETKSSYRIERETPSADRAARFVASLKMAGRNEVEAALSEARLTQLQNLIVEPRFAQTGFRAWQNYVGENPPGRSPIIHYVSPPGMLVADLMAGLLTCAVKSTTVHPVVHAALVSFGFVFVHPFEDGNGRIHRFLIHDCLSRDQLVPADMILPVSAHMLRYPHDYDRCLERFSEPLKAMIHYRLSESGELTVTNPEVVAGYYRYPDLTAQVAYLFQAIDRTIATELVAEVTFLQHYDEAKTRIRAVVDLPDRKLDLMIKCLHQNGGKLAKGKRTHFVELKDEEIHRMETEFQEVFSAEARSDDEADIEGEDEKTDDSSPAPQ